MRRNLIRLPKQHPLENGVSASLELGAHKSSTYARDSNENEPTTEHVAQDDFGTPVERVHPESKKN